MKTNYQLITELVRFIESNDKIKIVNEYFQSEYLTNLFNYDFYIDNTEVNKFVSILSLFNSKDNIKNFIPIYKFTDEKYIGIMNHKYVTIYRDLELDLIEVESFYDTKEVLWENVIATSLEEDYNYFLKNK